MYIHIPISRFGYLHAWVSSHSGGDEEVPLSANLKAWTPGHQHSGKQNSFLHACHVRAQTWFVSELKSESGPGLVFLIPGTVSAREEIFIMTVLNNKSVSSFFVLFCLEATTGSVLSPHLWLCSEYLMKCSGLNHGCLHERQVPSCCIISPTLFYSPLM